MNLCDHGRNPDTCRLPSSGPGEASCAERIIMKFPETTTYEVWSQTGGFEPGLESSDWATKDKAEGEATLLSATAAKYRPAEAAVKHYFVVAATTTRREVH